MTQPLLERSLTAENRYQELKMFREPFLRRARECAKYTIPLLVPEDNSTASTDVKTPRQGIGAEGVNNLASKLLITLLPPNTSCFRLRIDQFALDKEAPDEQLKTLLDEALGKIEQRVNDEIEASMDRVAVGEAMKQLIVAGNVLLFESKDGMRVFHLDSYVTKRDPVGNTAEIVIKEEVAPVVLPPEFWEHIKSKMADKGEETDDLKPVTVYTHVKRTQKNWTVYQEVEGETVPDTEGTYPLDACPWLPLRFNRNANEDYGRSYVEERLGDLKTLEALTEAITDGSLAAARLLILVNPAGTTRAKDVAAAKNGEVMQGNAADITTFQLDKARDFQTALSLLNIIEQRLGRAFLLTSSVQRQAERVTAEEIRIMVGELESALGGIYSVLTQEFSLPYVKLKMNKLEREKKLPPLPKQIVRPTVVTGLDAIGRNYDRNKLNEFMKTVMEVFGPEAIQTYINPTDAIKRYATSIGIDTDGLVRTEEEVVQQQQQAQMQQMAQQVGPQAVQQFGQIAQQQMAQGGMPNE